MSLKDAIRSKLGGTAVAEASKPPVEGTAVSGAATIAARAMEKAVSAQQAKPVIDLANLFTGIEGAKASFQSNYLRDGHYAVRIDRVKADQNRKKRIFIAIEMTVCFVIDGAEGKGHKAGEAVSHLLMSDADAFLPNWKAFVSKTLGVPEEEVSLQACVELCGDDQPLAGTLVEVTAKTIMTRGTAQKPPHPFTLVDYKREVPAQELLDVIDAKTKARLFPGTKLEDMAKYEREKDAPAPADAPAA